MKKIITILAIVTLLIPVYTFSQVQITNTTNYLTRDQMLLANEINESGEPFAEALGYDLDNLDPMILNTPDSIAYTLGIENYEYSRYHLGTLISRSGLGLHMMWAPFIVQMAAMETDPNFDGMYTGGTPNGFKEDDELMKNVMHFGMLANQMAPANPWPEFAEFIGGDPHLPQAINPDFMMDFSSLRWDRSLMDKTLNPAALGQALMKQYLWAQDMLGGFHDSLDNGIEPNGIITPDSVGSPNFDPNNNVFYGGDALDGFIGQILTAESINKVKFILSSLAYNGDSLGSVDPMTYDPMNGIKYFPHKISVTEGPSGPMLPPRVTALTVTDASSDLFDQLSLLWGTVSFKNMMDINDSSDAPHLAYKSVFDGNPFPAPMSVTGMPGPFDLMMGASKVLYMNLAAMHFNSTLGTFVNLSGLSNGMPQPGNEISTVNAGYIVMVLTHLVENFAGTPIESMALANLTAQADFLVNELQDVNGGFYNSYTIGSGVDNGAKLVVSQAAAIRGLYAAYSLTSNTVYLNAANTAYNYMISNFYVVAKTAFRTTEGNNQAVYTPFNFAIIAGALREANLVGNHADAPIIYTRFFKKIANVMQLSEGMASGETGSDSDGDGVPFIPQQADNLPPVFASEATLEVGTTGIGDNNRNDNESIALSNYPNPFTTHTNISFNLEESTNVRIEIYDLGGKQIETILDEGYNSGQHTIIWHNNNYKPGIYFYVLRTNKNHVVGRAQVLR